MFVHEVYTKREFLYKNSLHFRRIIIIIIIIIIVEFVVTLSVIIVCCCFCHVVEATSFCQLIRHYFCFDRREQIRKWWRFEIKDVIVYTRICTDVPIQYFTAGFFVVNVVFRSVIFVLCVICVIGAHRGLFLQQSPISNKLARTRRT